MRIQRKRTPGWRMPDNAVYVGRPTRWKNPYTITTSSQTGSIAVVTVNRRGVEQGGRWAGFATTHEAAAFAVDLYHRMLLDALERDPDVRGDFLAPLAGRDLACWCRPSQPCHADVLLRLANPDIAADHPKLHPAHLVHVGGGGL